MKPFFSQLFPQVEQVLSLRAQTKENFLFIRSVFSVCFVLACCVVTWLYIPTESLSEKPCCGKMLL
jgi:hypothetical protein